MGNSLVSVKSIAISAIMNDASFEPFMDDLEGIHEFVSARSESRFGLIGLYPYAIGMNDDESLDFEIWLSMDSNIDFDIAQMLNVRI